MSHLLKGSFTYPQDPPIISIIPKRKHFQWNSAIKKLCSHVNCFLYLEKQKRVGLTFFALLVSLLPPLDTHGNNVLKGEVRYRKYIRYQKSLIITHSETELGTFSTIYLDE